MLNGFMVDLSYKINGESKKISESKSCENNDFKLDVNVSKISYGEKVEIKIVPKSKVEIQKCSFKYDKNYENNSKVFVNGYESWTDSREFSKNEKLTAISRWVPKSIINKYHIYQYGDYLFKDTVRKSGVFHGFTYGYVRNNDKLNLVGSLTERNGYTIINYDMNNNTIVVEKDNSGLVIDKEYSAFDIVILDGREDQVFDTYFKEMNIEKPRVKPMTGYTSWYNHYQNITERILMKNINSLEGKVDIFQIDDGFQTAVGDWLSIDSYKFPNGMKVVADKAKEKGMIPGLWLAPFACEYNSNIVKEHSDWIVKNEDGSFCEGGSNWEGFYALDIYNAEFREYLRKVFNEVINKWGFEMLKLDFLYATCIVPRNNKTRGQIMCEAMDFIRECVGDKLILGCGVPLGPAFGKVDFCRIGCDVGLDWDDKWHMRLLHRERVSTKNAIINTIGRRQLNGRAFLNDPDVFLLRSDNISLTDSQKETLGFVNNLFGSLLFTSDDISKYKKDQKELFKKFLYKKNVEIVSVDEEAKESIKVIYKEDNIEYEALIDLANGESLKIKKR